MLRVSTSVSRPTWDDLGFRKDGWLCWLLGRFVSRQQARSAPSIVKCDRGKSVYTYPRGGSRSTELLQCLFSCSGPITFLFFFPAHTRLLIKKVPGLHTYALLPYRTSCGFIYTTNYYGVDMVRVRNERVVSQGRESITTWAAIMRYFDATVL